jgi:NifU-like protein involved in Fe-S cluster formation
MMDQDALAPQIRDLFAALDHAGEPAEGQGTIARGEAGMEATGTRVRFMLRAGAGRLLEVRYSAYGCPHTLATCEWLARSLEGRGLGTLEVGNPIRWAEQLSVPAAKLGRLLIVEDALSAALQSVERFGSKL